MFATFIKTELKPNLKSDKLNEDGSNLRELLMPIHGDQQAKDLFIPDNELLIDLNASIFCLEYGLSIFTSFRFNSRSNILKLDNIIIQIQVI